VLYQLEQIGVRSLGLAAITSTFTGMVIAIQFAYALSNFGGMEYIGRFMGLSFARELAPTLTAVIVGGRIGSGIAAEVGSMNVTEQVDAIRALGADPIKKLVMPRVVAAVIALPILCAFSLALGFTGGMIIVYQQFGIPMGFFYHSGLDSTWVIDFASGMIKTPIFGYIIAIIGCFYGLRTRGGTEGVGNATTSTVVAVAVCILLADFVMTKISLILFGMMFS
jgi:phospholipid/cholesterol/gamma-HCH transport system permease protein